MTSVEIFSPPSTADPLCFAIKAATLKFDTREDILPYVKPLIENADVEEVHLSGNTYGVEVCKFLAEILSTKKNLKVHTPLILARVYGACLLRIVLILPDCPVCRYFLNPFTHRDSSVLDVSPQRDSESSKVTHYQPFRQCFRSNCTRTTHQVPFFPRSSRTLIPRQ